MKNLRLSVFLFLGLGLLSCTHPTQPSLRDASEGLFLMGCAVSSDIVSDTESSAHRLVAEQFSSLVAENCMKPERLCPAEGKWTFDEADRFIEMAERNGQKVIGHCLVWHSQAARWMFVDSLGMPVARDVLVERMREYIHMVVGRYRGRVLGWDVCNECYTDDGALRDSEWSRIIGEDFIELAFRFAHEADPDVELYYNDYNMFAPGKCESVCAMVKRLQAAGCRIDAVGMQSHLGLDWPELADYERSMEKIIATGVRINISELDLNILPRPEGFGGAGVEQHFVSTPEMDPYREGLPPAVEEAVNRRWLDLFAIYRKYASSIERVTIWGVGDGDSWLNDWPIRGRRAYATMVDRRYQLKPVAYDVMALLEE